ncbi:TPA: hypothetical protein RQN23_004508 [Aeromonas veronii]|nr:hypothetical protein [Aeromonas veronii]
MHQVDDKRAELTELEKKLINAEEAVISARVIMNNEQLAVKLAPLKPFFSRIYEWFSSSKTTPAQVALCDAESRLKLAKVSAYRAAQQWVRYSAEHRLADNAVDTQQCQRLQVSLENAQKRKEKVLRLLALADTAHRCFGKALADSRSASDMEFIDLVSTNTGISILSTLETEDAASSLRQAKKSLRDLAEAMPKRSSHQEIEIPDDWLDLAFDFCFEPFFDFLSWSNMEKLDSAASKCEQVIDAIEPLLSKLNNTIQCLSAKIDNDTAAIKAIEKTYVEAAIADLPLKLRDLHRY